MRGLLLAFVAVLSTACLDFDGFGTGSTSSAGGGSSQGGGGSGPVTTGGGMTSAGGASGSGGSGGSGTGGAGPIAPCVTDDFNSAAMTANFFDPMIEAGPPTPAATLTFGAGLLTIDVLEGQAGGYRSKAASDLRNCFVSLEASVLPKNALTFLAIRSFASSSSRVRVYLEPLTGNNLQACADVDGISLGCTAVPDTTVVLRIAPGPTDLAIDAIDLGASVASFTTPRPNWLATGSIAFGVDATTLTGPDQQAEIQSFGLTPP